MNPKKQIRSFRVSDIKMKKVAKDPNVERVAQQEKKVSVQKRKGSEIDEIFAAKKRKKLETEKKAEAKAKVAASKVRPPDKKKGKSLKSRSSEQSSFAVSTSGPRKKTADGLAVFSEEELGIGKPDAGGTALCPFDCGCCF
ncbi:stress response protein [Salvia divinorum]|uniref:Stress response protein n=1 Tax=Salvia divinorum TaxID=28513 RepID=A0ABD1GU54_SALDI